MSKEERTKSLTERHNRKAIETGMRLQGEFFLRGLHELDEVDEDWTEAWLTWIHDFLYNRNVLDDKTRTLVVIGECCVLGHTNQMANHMRTALRVGATPEEIVEVLLQATVYCGMPKAIQSVRIFRDLMTDLGLKQYTPPPYRSDARD